MSDLRAVPSADVRDIATVSRADFALVSQGGTTAKAPISAITALVGEEYAATLTASAAASFASAAAAAASVASIDTFILNNVLTVPQIRAIVGADRFNGNVKIGNTGIAGEDLRIYVYNSTSGAPSNDSTVILPNALSESDGGRWVAVGSRVRTMLAWGQSNMAQDAPRTVTKANALPLFPTSPPHPNVTTSDNGDGTYDQVFVGRVSAGVFLYDPGNEIIRRAEGTSNPLAGGTNNTAFGLASAHYDQTGESVVIVHVAQGSVPIERFLTSSVANVTAATQAATAIITISDLRFIPSSAGVPVRFTGIGGMTQLNTGTYVAKTPTPAWSTYRGATAPVSGTFQLFESNGTTPVNSTAFGAYTSGGVALMHDLLDAIDVDVPLAFGLISASKFDFIVGFQGEANGGAVPSDTVSTVGGVATFPGYLAKRREWVNLMRSKGYADGNTIFLDFELGRFDTNAPEKPRNDVIGVLPNMDAKYSVVASAGYTGVDNSHIDDHWGHGYFPGGDALALALAGNQATIPVPRQERDTLRFDGSRGFRRNVVLLDQQTLDLSGLSKAEYQSYLNGTCFTIRSSKIILPPFAVAAGDLGLTWMVLQWSVTGTTPGEANGNSVIECAGLNFFVNGAGAVADEITMDATYNSIGTTFDFLRTTSIYVRR